MLYLIFTEGHTATPATTPVRAELSRRGDPAGPAAGRLMPDEPEVLGLLALLLLTDARRAGPGDADGPLVLLAEQDRRAGTRR